MGEPKSSDDRQATRHKTLLAGRIIFSGGTVTVDCTIRDRSDSGARISLGHAVTVPDHFTLEIPDRRERLRARLVWANGTEAGIAIDPEHGDANGEEALRRRIRELERSVLMLQNRIRELDGSTGIN